MGVSSSNEMLLRHNTRYRICLAPARLLRGDLLRTIGPALTERRSTLTKATSEEAQTRYTRVARNPPKDSSDEVVARYLVLPKAQIGLEYARSEQAEEARNGQQS